MFKRLIQLLIGLVVIAGLGSFLIPANQQVSRSLYLRPQTRVLVETGGLDPAVAAKAFAGEIAEEIWTGTGATENQLNRDMTTRLPVSDIAGALEPGIYVLQAAIPKSDPYDSPKASQWFVVSDLGLSTMNGVDGLHAFVRSLATAEAKSGAAVTLLSRANAVLGGATTDNQGYARFAPGLSAGPGGAAPAMLTVEDGDDLAFLPLTGPEFDLSDRGVEGRRAPGPLDVYATTERGAYRPGETVHATVLACASRAKAVTDVPLTAVLTRPDGVEHSRTVLKETPGERVFGPKTVSEVPATVLPMTEHQLADGSNTVPAVVSGGAAAFPPASWLG